MKIRFWGILLVLGLLATEVWASDDTKSLSALEGRYWRFSAETTQSISSSTDQLNGKYEIAILGGELRFRLLNGDGVPVGARTEAELKEMVIFGKGERQYVKLSLAVGAKWSTRYFYNLPGGRGFWRSVDYEVKAIEEVTTPAGRFQTFRIEGDATEYSRSGPIQLKWVIHYSPEADSIVKYNFDSAVGQEGAKITMELIEKGVRVPATKQTKTK